MGRAVRIGQSGCSRHQAISAMVTTRYLGLSVVVVGGLLILGSASHLSAASLQTFTEKDVQEQIQRLRSESLDEREQATRQLIRMGDSARPVLRRVAQDADAELAVRAAHVLRVIELSGRFRTEFMRSRLSLLEQLASGPGDVWCTAFLDLAAEYRSVDPAAHPEVRNDLEILVDQALAGARTVGDKIRICRGIGRWALGGPAEKVCALLHEPSPALRVAAAQALMEARAVGALPELLKILLHEDWALRAIATCLLRILDAERSSGEVSRMARDRDAHVRERAFEVLGELGTPTALKEIRKGLSEVVDSVRAAAVTAFGRAAESGEHREVLELLADESAEVRAAAVRALRELGASAAAADIMKLLKDKSEDVRCEAVRALGELREARALPEIRALLSSPSIPVRVEAIWAWARIEGEGARAGLEKLLTDSDEAVRMIASRALGIVGQERSIRALEPLLEDKSPLVRAQAVSSLCRLGLESAAKLVVEMGGDHDVLNAVRRQDVWKALRETKLASDIQGTPREVAAQIARVAGLALVWRWKSSEDPIAWAVEHGRVRVRALGGKSALEALEELNMPFVLERGKVIVLAPKDSIRFWVLVDFGENCSDGNGIVPLQHED